MQDLILYIVKNLVTNPEAVSVEEQNEDGQVNLLLTVDPADMGLIIGKGGQTIKAIRKVLIVKAMADNVRVNLQLAEPEGGRPDRSDKSEDKETLPSSGEEGQQVSEASESAESVEQSTSEPETPEEVIASEDTDTPEDRSTDQAETADTAEPTDQTDTPISPSLEGKVPLSDLSEEPTPKKSKKA